MSPALQSFDRDAPGDLQTWCSGYESVLGSENTLGVLDTRATISLVAKKTLPQGDVKNIMPTAALRMGDGHVVHSCGECEVEVPMGSRSIAHWFYVMDTPRRLLRRTLPDSIPYTAGALLPPGGPLEQSEHTSSYLSVGQKEPSTVMVAYKTEDYQLLRDILDQGLKQLGYSREDLNVELFASDKQHVFDLYCSKGKHCCYKFYGPSFGMAYANPGFSELGNVLTKVALERSCMVLCSPDWGAQGRKEYLRTLLDKLTLTSIRLPDDAIYVLLGCKTPIGKPG